MKPNTSIRVDPDILHQARVAAVIKKETMGKWLEEAILDKIKREQKREAQPSVKGVPIVPPTAELIHGLHTEGAAEEEMEQDISQRIVEAPAPVQPHLAPSAPAEPGEWEYWLQDGRGPFETVQTAMDALGLDRQNRPQHNRWDRLSTQLKEQIRRVAKQ